MKRIVYELHAKIVEFPDNEYMYKTMNYQNGTVLKDLGIIRKGSIHYDENKPLNNQTFQI